MQNKFDRPIVFGTFIALDGDKTTTGARCIATSKTKKINNQSILSLGDLTTLCPKCKRKGTIITGIVIWGELHAVEGSIVQCNCPYGSNVVIIDGLQRKKLFSGLFSMELSECRYFPPSTR